MTAKNQVSGARFRLRFLLQELELGQGETLLGRSNDCRVTIFDPLISRVHARILVDGDKAVLEDLGSRNGVRVNGAPITGPYALKAGDRIRIGKHELVFGDLSRTVDPALRRTGSLVFCASCDVAYPMELGMCPTCGSKQSLDEDTRSGPFDGEGKESWALDMFVELFNKAMTTARVTDAERVMRQIIETLDSHLKNFKKIDSQRLDPIAETAVTLSTAQANPFWVRWAMDFYGRAGNRVPASLAEAAARSADEPAGTRIVEIGSKAPPSTARRGSRPVSHH